MTYVLTEYYDSLSLSNAAVREASTSKLRANDYPSVDELPGDNERQKQILMQKPENRYQFEVAEEVEKIEKDSQALNEIFKDLAIIINVSQTRSSDQTSIFLYGYCNLFRKSRVNIELVSVVFVFVEVALRQPLYIAFCNSGWKRVRKESF